ncbi:MAG: ribosomal protein S18-alanine N-acetyltransferase [Acidobacteriota bacterium]|nr:ribosomal protein S18-alanine N-acetyltransferase [Acidobacteriota bacterium]
MIGDDMLIRTATFADVPAMCELEEQSVAAAHWSEHEYDALFAADAPPRRVLVAVNGTDDAVMGFLIASCATDAWEIENVVVAPEERRQGIASELVSNLISRARAGAATSVLLEVRESNAAARGLYEKHGFRLQGRRPQYYRDPGEDALLLQFSIAVL